MKSNIAVSTLALLGLVVLILSAKIPLQTLASKEHPTNAPIKRYLYVAVPGIRDYLGYGGHGILVFDIDNNHRFVKRIKTQGFHPDKTPSNVKGIAVSLPLNSIYISTLESLQRIDISTEKIVWEKQFEGGCDRMSISPDGKLMYLPSLKKLQDVVSLSERKGIHVYFVVPLQWNRYQYRELIPVISRLNNQDVLCFFNVYQLNEIYQAHHFADPNHLNVTGAVMYTELLFNTFLEHRRSGVDGMRK